MNIRRSKPAPLTIDQVESLARHTVAHLLSSPGYTAEIVRSQIASEDGLSGWSQTWAAHRHEVTCPTHEAIRAAFNAAALAILDR
jgi:hypothetical protein